MKKVGILIFVLGLALTVFTAVSFFTQEKVVDLGKVEITRKKEHHLNISPLIGIAVMGLGGIIIWQANNKK